MWLQRPSAYLQQVFSSRWLELNLIYRFVLYFRFCCCFTFSPNHVIGHCCFDCGRRGKNEIINLLKSQIHFVGLSRLRLVDLQLMSMGKCNQFHARAPAIMLHHYDALLTGLPWIKVKPLVAWYLTVILRDNSYKVISFLTSLLR